MQVVATLAYKIHCVTVNGRLVMLDNLPWKTAGKDPEENTKLWGLLKESIGQARHLL